MWKGKIIFVKYNFWGVCEFSKFVDVLNGDVVNCVNIWRLIE